MYAGKGTEWLQAKLKDVDWDIKRLLRKILEMNANSWKDLLAVLPGWVTSEDRISVHQLEKTDSPAFVLLQQLEQWGFTMAQLIACLEAINMESALLIIKPDVELNIEEDIQDSMEAVVGKPLKLSCRATGFPTPRYQWFKDDVELLDQNSSRLIKDNVCLQDCGVYKCKIYTFDRLTNEERPNPLFTKSCKVHVSEPVTLRLTGRPPQVEIQPVSPGDYVPQGCTFILECRATGDPPITYEWFRDNICIPGETSSELLFPHLQPDETTGKSSWKFQCLVKNNFGSVFSHAVNVGISKRDRRFIARDKVALLIANENYKLMDSFKLPSADVETLSCILKDLGFRVMSYVDLTLNEMKKAVHLFCNELGPGVYGFFYFAGHGFEDQGQSYMQPVDATENCDFDHENMCVDFVATIMQEHDPAMSCFLLDMCRERPDHPDHERLRTHQEKKYKNTVFGYATSFLGEAVEVENSSNGLFVEYLKRHLAKNKSIPEILWDVVQDMSNDRCAQREEQYPCIVYNICEGRGLRDPIHSPVSSKAIYDSKWEKIYKCPDTVAFKLGPVHFCVSFMPHRNTFCNAIDMVIKFEDDLPEETSTESDRLFTVQITPDFLHITESVHSDKARCFAIRGLQNLTTESVHYIVEMETSDEMFSHSGSFFMPGLASLKLSQNLLL